MAVAGVVVRAIHGAVLRTFMRLAPRDVAMQKRFGVVGVTAVVTFGAGPLWAAPLTSANISA